MSWAGSAISAVVSLKYNRSLTSNKNAIRYYKHRANEIRTRKIKKNELEYNFESKKYNDLEYAAMKRRINRNIKSKLLYDLGMAIVIFILLAAFIAYVFIL